MTSDALRKAVEYVKLNFYGLLKASQHYSIFGMNYEASKYLGIIEIDSLIHVSASDDIYLWDFKHH